MLILFTINLVKLESVCLFLLDRGSTRYYCRLQPTTPAIVPYHPDIYYMFIYSRHKILASVTSVAIYRPVALVRSFGTRFNTCTAGKEVTPSIQLL
jgi:hypothetical protein